MDANRLNYVLVNGTSPADADVIASGKLQIGESRVAGDVRCFSDELRQLVTSLAPTVVTIKAKPESGQMRAGPAALKMEALILAQTTCDVYFLSPQRLAVIETKSDLYAYQQGAWKAAVGGFDPPKLKKKPPAKAKTK
jgi:hypothetical protein